MAFIVGKTGIIKDGLVLYLDAGNLGSYPGSGDTWYDLSGNHYDATLINGVGYDGDNGGSLVFNGGLQKAYSPPSGDPFSVYGPANITFCMKPTNLVQESIVGIYNRHNQFAAVQIGFRDSGNSFGVWQLGGTWLLQLDNPIQQNVITQISVNYSGSVISIYKDGNLIGNTTSANQNQSGNGYLIISGFNLTDIWEGFYGNMYSCFIYDRVLSESEIKINFNNTKKRFGI